MSHVREIRTKPRGSVTGLRLGYSRFKLERTRGGPTNPLKTFRDMIVLWQLPAAILYRRKTRGVFMARRIEADEVVKEATRGDAN